MTQRLIAASCWPTLPPGQRGFKHFTSLIQICNANFDDLLYRQGPPQDELTRLRRRVAELEHTVRVLTQRASPREAGDEKPLMPASPPKGQSPDEYEDIKKHRSRPEDGSGQWISMTEVTWPIDLLGSGLSGQPSRPSGTLMIDSLSKSDYSTVPHYLGRPGGLDSNVAHCGCAASIAGREVLGQLQNNLSASIQRLKALPEHQKHVINCPLYSQVKNLHDYVRFVIPHSIPSLRRADTHWFQANKWNCSSFLPSNELPITIITI